MEVRTYLIKLGKIYQSGELCTPLEDPKFFSTHPNTILNCKVSGGYLRIQMIAYQGKYYPIRVEIRCDECEVCDPIVYDIYPASDASDCSLCQTYDDTKKLCVDKCYPKKCDPNTGACLDCLPGDRGPCNQVCLNGTFDCPPELPYKGEDNCCYECYEGQDLGECLLCVGGFIVAKDCNGHPCDEVKGCVECLADGDCSDKPNHCCNPITNKCECCEGYKKDLQGNCVKKDPCEYDRDCLGPCEKCGPDHYCYEPECPTGQTRHPVTCECTSTKCFGSCDNGRDCGPGCGCNKITNLCEPCGLFNCGQGLDACDNVLGCFCVPGLNQVCTDVDGPDDTCKECSTYQECGLDETCYKGCCVKCSNFNCENTDCSNTPGCACNDEVKCGGDGERRNGDCEDTIDIYMDHCNLVDRFNKVGTSCNCSALTFLTEPVVKSTGNQWGTEWTVSLRKGYSVTPSIAKLLNLVSDTSKPNIASNETPISGELTLTVSYKIRKPNEGKDVIVIDNDRTQTKAWGSGIGSVTFVNVFFYKIGQLFEGFEVKQVIITITQSADFKFPNGCTYKQNTVIANKILGTSAITDLNLYYNPSDYNEATPIESNMQRMPLYIYSRGESQSNMVPYRKVYLAMTGNQRINNAYTPKNVITEIDNNNKKFLNTDEGGIYSGYFYSLNIDCSCDSNKVAQAIVCDDIDWGSIFTFTDCNCEATAVQPSNICAINQDVTQFSTNINVPSNAQTKYKVVIAGVNIQGVSEFKTYTFQHKKNVGMINVATGNPINHASEKFGFGNGTKILSITVTLLVNQKEYCPTILYPDESTVNGISSSSNCGSGDYYSVVINKSQAYPEGNKTIESISFTTEADKTGSTIILKQNEPGFLRYDVPKNVNVYATIKFTDGCYTEQLLFDTCCNDIELTVSGEDSAECGTGLHLQRHVFYAADIVSTFWTLPNGNVVPGENITGDLILANPIAGTYTVKITDSLGCEAETSIAINNIQTQPILKYTGNFSIFTGSSTTITIDGGAANAGATVSYTANGVPGSFILDNTGKYVIGPIWTAGTYNFNTIQVGDCIWTLTDVVVITVSSAPQAILSVDTNPLCIGSSTTLTVTGTPGAIATITQGIGPVTIGLNGTWSTTITPMAHTTYLVTQIVYGGNTFAGGSTVTVNMLTGTTITMVGNDGVCNQALTEKTYTFNTTITSAEDQAGNPIIPVANTVTIDPVVVTSFTVYKDNGNCISELLVQVSPCACPPGTLTLWTGVPNNRINQGDSLVIYAQIESSYPLYDFYWLGVETHTDIPEDSVGSGIAIDSISITPTGSMSLTVYVQDVSGNCYWEETINIEVLPVNPTELLVCDYVGEFDGSAFAQAEVLTGFKMIDGNGDTIDLADEAGFHFPYCLRDVPLGLNCTTPNLDVFIQDLETWLTGLNVYYGSITGDYTDSPKRETPNDYAWIKIENYDNSTYKFKYLGIISQRYGTPINLTTQKSMELYPNEANACEHITLVP